MHFRRPSDCATGGFGGECRGRTDQQFDRSGSAATRRGHERFQCRARREFMIESHVAVKPPSELTTARRGLVEKRLRHALKSPAKTVSIPTRPTAESAPLSFA